jgi:L-arabinokinase
VAPGLLRRTLQVPYELLPGACDTGVVQTSSIAHDDEATVREALAFHADFDRRVEHEVGALARQPVRLVVSDIPALAFAVADRLGVPSVAISNFTWDWIYETHPGFLPAGEAVVAEIRGCYQRAHLALELPFSGGFDVFPHVERLPLVARRPTRSRRDTRAFFDLPAKGRAALLSFGGYGLASLDLSTIDCAPGWTIVTTDSVSGARDLPPYVRGVPESAFLSSDFRYEDLIAAVDVVMTKPGYGIIAECISTGTAMVYTSRGVFREADVLVAALPRFVRARFISQADLLGGRWREALDGVLLQADAPERMDLNGADLAAERLNDLAG